MKLIALLLICLAIAAAQDAPPTTSAEPPKPGAISGTATVSGTGAPMKGVQVSIGRGAGARTALTDAAGHYTLSDIAPGMLRVIAAAPDASGRFGGFSPNVTRQITLAPGQELSTVDFQMILPGSITGKVVDQNKEPVPGMFVILVMREYTHGALRAYIGGLANTDDEGMYTLGRVTPGRTYAVLVKRGRRNLQPISNAPIEPALRLPSVLPTYFPTAPSLDGAEPLVLRPGEVRENVDIRVTRTPSFCAEGVLEDSSGPDAVSFSISETQPTSGQTGSGGFYVAETGGKTGPDGKFRICDLHPGDYELTIYSYGAAGMGAAQFNSAVISVSDRDLKGIRLGLRPKIPVAGEVVIEGPPPETPIEAKLRIDTEAVTRTERGSAQASIPGEFAFEGGLLMDQYALTINGVPSGMYVKDVTYGGRSVLNKPLPVGTAIGDAGLRVTLARDGGSVAVRVADKDGAPVSDCTVVVLPATAANEAEFAALMKNGLTDAAGKWSSATIAPGKYIALATRDAVNRSPEVISKLWKGRTRGAEFEITAGGKPTVTLVPRSLD